ncbi:uncharacterized protein SPPG_00974 [Spizellomyces punctatus DAOM BR117]|uniref:GH15-like domain-containing protein n=1 Tax=Spizellomyces punctatus (strain DAOM BR117) TaxID=645134 RepID=A0A0L0HRC2_SPIPD|nr:uncharacterized protein SPPG_00974 [Spizellomyces punctatus DAOM BR117]KND03490.1 hypothetical protein SPPG_00974 [Spizellomyces punctatus DAOM BR117]|eukprot:XP_016611529.1 hypothetical protein SPPG_00974 [Spizellomyces punctatus DAOM BR117]
MAIEHPPLKVLVHNKVLAQHIKQSYTRKDIESIWSLLNAKKSLDFPTVTGRGLFKAALAHSEDESDYTGYDNVWVRDNIHVAHAHWVIGKADAAVRTIDDLAAFWLNPTSEKRWKDCITQKVDYNADVMQRPHIRFNGTLLQENEQTWAHAQNDAIGYFVWLLCSLINEGHTTLAESHIQLLTLIPLYFNTIQFHQDQDSGHWEEARKVEASSIGPVTAGLSAVLSLLSKDPAAASVLQTSYTKTARELSLTTLPETYVELIKTLHTAGTQILASLLPSESPSRKTDAALLFLLYPLRLPIPNQTKHEIITNVVKDLAGDYGIRRYKGDSYWMANYKKVFSEENRTADFSNDMSARDQFLKEGQEAQWCIFDSILSCIYGHLYMEAKNDSNKTPDHLQQLKESQVLYFNRALGQITGSENCPFGEFWCPESYYIEDGKYVTNDVCPLLWTQANLVCAMSMMLKTLEA